MPVTPPLAVENHQTPLPILRLVHVSNIGTYVYYYIKYKDTRNFRGCTSNLTLITPIRNSCAIIRQATLVANYVFILLSVDGISENRVLLLVVPGTGLGTNVIVHSIQY